MRRRQRQRRRDRNRGHPIRRVALMVVTLALSAASIAVLAGVSWVVSVAQSAPTIPPRPSSTGAAPDVLYNGDGSLLGYIVPGRLSLHLPYSRIPPHLEEATVAIEDRRFWKHGAIDYQGVARAALKDLLGGGNSDVQGASTLTMQLVKNSYTPRSIGPEQRTVSIAGIKYKIIQAELAEELQAHHSRQWILDSYLNEVTYGQDRRINTALIGVQAASESFFGKPVSKLNLAQDALLAGLPQLPTEYDPFKYPDRARARRREVLQAMVQSHYISQALADAVDRQSLWLNAADQYSYESDPYIYNYTEQQLLADVGHRAVNAGGLKVYATISPQLDAAAQRAIANNPPGSQGPLGQPSAALASVNPDNGHIVALAASESYAQRKFFYPVQAERQTGSAFKAFVLMTLIKDYDGDPNTTYYTSMFLPAGWDPSEPNWSVHTAEESYQGTINLTRATYTSDNTVFVQLAVDENPFKFDEIAHEMGITSPLQGVPAEAIGGLAHCCTMLEMADAYATIANGGYHDPATIIDRVVFPNGRVKTFGSSPGTQVFTDGQAYAATNVLKQVLTMPGATGTNAYYGCPAAGKTGTAEGEDNAWFVGYTPRFSTAVWVGYPKGQGAPYAMLNGFGGTLAAPIWRSYMLSASNGYCGDFHLPNTQWYGTQFLGPHAKTKLAPAKKGPHRHHAKKPAKGTAKGGTSPPKSGHGGSPPPTGNGGGSPPPTGNGGGTPPPSGNGGTQPPSGGGGLTG